MFLIFSIKQRYGSAMAAPLDLDQLQTFVAIADTGSFTRAADEVQKLTDKFVAEVEKALEAKETDLMAV